ncbi:MAG TPA: branched-chain amino acid ABC transporter permease [Dehalococcoidia bacterium]|nr:branched-chain amino acid ABC transporter permease [Dehalococcoidia bacterium]
MNIGPEQLLAVLLIGISNGLLLGLIALGYTLVYGIIELINFAHGDVFMLGTMLALTLVTSFGLRGTTTDPLVLFPLLLLIIVVVMIFTALVNVTIERVAYRPLRRAPKLAPLISAIGVSFILINIGLVWRGASQVNFPGVIPVHDVIGGASPILGGTAIQYTTKDLAVLVLAIPLMIGLDLFVQRTRLGKAMRATAQDQEAAALMGINVNTTIALTFVIGGALAGAAGFIFGMYNSYAWFLQGFRGGLFAFTSAVVGGIGNIRGAFLGGLIIGLIQAFSDFFIDTKWTQVVVFGILILILVFRPSGILGEAVPERA